MFVNLLGICQTEAVSQPLVLASIGRQSFRGTVGHLIFDKAWVYGRPQNVLHIVLRFYENRFHGRQGGCGARFDVLIHAFEQVRRDTNLSGRLGSSIRVVDVGHDGGQFVQERVVPIHLSRQKTVSRGHTHSGNGLLPSLGTPCSHRTFELD